MSNRENSPSSDASDSAFDTRFPLDEPPSEAVIEALAAIEGVEPNELDPLYESIDPEALDELVGHSSIDGGEPAIVTTFTASGYRVIVSSHGSISVLDGEDDG